MKSKVFLYSKKFENQVEIGNFQLIEEELEELKEGQFIADAVYISVDPYVRTLALKFPTGITMIGRQIAKVIESKNESYPVGTIIFGNLGWRSKTLVDPSKFPNKFDLYPLPDLGSLPHSLGLGILGMPGNSAYYGFLELCQPKTGETVVVTAAAGAVGTLVGQIAKIKGCKVIGFAGSDEKCQWLEKEYGFDKAINYKVGDMAKALKEVAPNGVDCYFDNVGGELSSIIYEQMNDFGRISVCGSISAYNDQNPKVSAPQVVINLKQLEIRGFIVHRWVDRWQEGIKQMLKWIQEGKIKYHETVTEGFENMPKAFLEMMMGKNSGKAIVKV